MLDDIERYREPWDAWFGDRTLARGTTYARQARVRIDGAHRIGNWLQLLARVEGSRSYQTVVRLEFPECEVDGSWLCGELETVCSCPVGDYCKHAVAVIVSAEQQMLPAAPPQKRLPRFGPGRPPARKPPEDELPEGFPDWQLAMDRELFQEERGRRWLAGIASGDGILRKRRLIWVIAIDEQGNWLLQPGWQQLGKHGWAAPRPLVNPPKLSHEDRQRLTPVDQALLDNPDMDLPWATVAEAVATGRVFAKVANHWRVLTLGPTRSLHASWQERDGLLALALAIDGLPEAELHAGPPCWSDDASGTVGPVDLPPSALDGLLPAPELDHALAHEATAELRRRGIAVDDPPAEDASRRATLQGEIAIFRVQALRLSYGGWGRPGSEAPLDLLLPCFRYDEERLPPLPGARLPDGRLRDRAGEERLLAALPAAGLHPVDEIVGRLSLPRLPHRHFCWSPWSAGAVDQGEEQLPEGAVSERDLRLLALAGWRLEGREVALEQVPTRSLQLELREQDDGAVLGLAGEHEGGEVDLVPLLAMALREGIEALPTTEHEGRPHVAWADPADPTRLLLVDSALLAELVEQLLALHAGAPKEGEEWRIDLDAAAALADGSLDARIDGGRLRRLVDALGAASHPSAIDPAEGFELALRDYQRLGLGWLERLAELGFGGVLADDMGLGKTAQCLAHIWNRHQAGELAHGCLVVAPVSTLGNWLREAERCCPQLRCQLWHGPKRGPLPSAGDADLLLTSYATLQRSKKRFDDRVFDLVVCDEAQQLRNPVAKTTRALKTIGGERRLALTGTPLENSHDDLWSLVSWIEPGWLGSLASFRRRVEAEAESGALRRRLTPILLRRTKQAVASDLPPRTEIVERIDLSSDQAALYETVRAASDARIGSLLAERGLAKSRIHILEALLRLRQVCCDPRLLPESHDREAPSAKREQLLTMLAELQAEGRQALVFSTFASLLELLAEDLTHHGISHELLTGKTRKRQERIDRFQAGGATAFLISLKAGGTGLNLTAADTVIHLDPWWNPAAERQAADRAHRIGQDKPVFIYKLIAAGTIEDRILELQRRKARMLDDLFDQSGQALGRLDEQTLRELLAPISS